MKVQNGAAIIILVVCSLFFSGIVFAAVVKINWNSNTESDLAGYKVFCGTEPGNYSYILNVQYCKPIYVSGLQDGLTYYFAVSAYDSSGNESALSRDVQQAVPQNNPLDNLISLSLQPMELLYQLGTYDPLYSLTLENTLSGIRMDLPAGATDGSLPLAIGSLREVTGTWSYAEFDLVPYGYVLRQAAAVTVPFTGNKASVVRYDEGTRLWVGVDGVSIVNGSVKYSTQTLGKFRIYSGESNPFSQQISGEGSNKSSGGGGGGGCFIETSSNSMTSSFLFSIISAAVVCARAFLSTGKRYNLNL